MNLCIRIHGEYTSDDGGKPVVVSAVSPTHVWFHSKHVPYIDPTFESLWHIVTFLKNYTSVDEHLSLEPWARPDNSDRK
jgi:hypothetical protein